MEYVCTGATLKCTMGTSCPKLKATPKNVTLTGKDQANIADYVSMKNIPSFGRCRSLGYPPTASATAANHGKLTPMPCVPGTCPKWKAIDKDSLICGEPALLKPATLKCMYGGTISIVDPGQTLEIKVRAVPPQTKNENKQKVEQDIPEELIQEFNELDTEGLNKDSVLDGVQLALDAAGMVPVLGAIPDLINASISVLRGDWVGAGISIVAAVPGVGDVVGGAKIAYKGAKIASKSTKITKAKNVSKSTKTHSGNSQIKNGSPIRQNQSNVSDNFCNGSLTDKERQQLREIRAKRAGVKPQEMHEEILYDSLPDSESEVSKFMDLLNDYKSSGATPKDIPDLELNTNTPNIFSSQVEIKPDIEYNKTDLIINTKKIDADSQKALEDTKYQLKKDAESRSNSHKPDFDVNA